MACNSEETNMLRVIIYGKLLNLPMDLPDADLVRVIRVPKSMSSVRPEAFTPHCVGLGPYYHFDSELIMTDEMKLSVANRVDCVKALLPKDASNGFEFDNNIIEAFYHTDGHNRCDNLMYVMAVDGLFLLAFLKRDAASNLSYFLTGKRGITLVNASGVEVTMDAIVRDVFMLENQIPVHVLDKIIIRGKHNNFQIKQEYHLGQTMLDFCTPFCPFVYPQQLSPREAQDCVHLLDLMYHLTVPLHVTKSEEKPQPNQHNCFYICVYIISIPLILHIIIEWVFIYWVMYIIQLLIRWVLRPLFSKAIPWAVGPLFGTPRQMPTFGYFMSHFLGFLFPFLKLKLWDSTNYSEQDVTIPSATELCQVFMKVKPAEGGISSIRSQQSQFYMPQIRLDANSEVIMRNLMAYESLTKSRDDSIFTHYIDLMSSLIVTAEDVKLLVRNKVIDTQLSDNAVAQLFNGMMSKSIWPTNIQHLEDAIKKVRSVFNYRKMLRWFSVEYWRVILIILAVSVLYPLLWDVFMEVFCLTSFRDAPICRFRRERDYGKNISFLSSM